MGDSIKGDDSSVRTTSKNSNYHLYRDSFGHMALLVWSGLHQLIKMLNLVDFGPELALAECLLSKVQSAFLILNPEDEANDDECSPRSST